MARRAPPPLPAPQPTAADKDASPKTTRPPTKPTSQQQQPIPTPAPASSAHSSDAAILTDLKLASSAKQRKEAAIKRPELRPPHDALNHRENAILELAFWQARTYREIAELKNLARREVGTRIRKALKKLDQHLHGELHEDEDRLEEVLLALNECSSVRRAAKKLKLPKDVLKAFMEREGVKTRVVFEVDT